VTLRPRRGRSFANDYLDTVWPYLEGRGAVPLCCLNGVIGASADEWLLVTGFGSLDDYAQVQADLSVVASATAAEAGPVTAALQRRRDAVTSERIRLVTACAQRPKALLEPADRRDYYGVRHFYVGQPDRAEFVRTSADGVWPLIESQDARILGMFRDLAAADPLDVLLLTGYTGPAHWEATRGISYPRPDGFPADAWQAAKDAAAQRPALIQRSYVWLMRAHWPA
jgi:hypothetical protein